MIEFLYDLFYMLPLNIVLVLNIWTYMHRTDNSIQGCIAGTAFIVLMLTLRHTGRKERFLIGGGAIVAAVGLLWVLGEEKREILYEQYGYMLWILGVAVICIILGKLAQDYLWLKLAIALSLVGNNIYLMVSKTTALRATIFGTFFVIMVFLAEIVQRYWKKSGYTDLKMHIALIAPVLMIVFILGCVIPAPEKPYDWRIAKDLWKMTVTEYKRISGYLANKNDEYKYAGFSEESSFGSAVGSNDKDVMMIYTDDRSFDRLYLGGITFEDYVSNGWETDLEGEDNYRQLDLLETRAAIALYGSGYEREYIQEDVIEIESRMFNTKHVFLPVKTNLDSKKTVIPKYRETRESVLADSKLKYGDSYSMSYYRLNFANPDLIALLDDAAPIDNDTWDMVVRKAAVSDKESCSYEKYQAYRDFIHEEYGDSNGISPKLTALIDEVTQGIDGDYERLKAIAEYLQSMEYNTHPGPIPSKVTNASEYLDYMILESRQGYCVHYATTFVLLARECGFPARYVQGYYVKKDSKANEVLVTKKRAHSWAEVYFDNFGWVSFEATPGYFQSRGWKVGNVVDSSAQMGYVKYEPEIPSSEETATEEIPQEEEKKVIHISYVVIPILLAVFFVVLYLFINRLVTAFKYKRMNSEEKIRFLTLRNLRILKLMGYPINENETLQEYRGRVMAGLMDEKLELGFLSLYEMLLYSDYTVREDDIRIIEEEYDLLKYKIHAHGFRYRMYIL